LVLLHKFGCWIDVWGHVANMRGKRGACRILVGKLKERNHLDLKVIDWKDVDWIHMTDDTDQVFSHRTMVINLWVLWNMRNFLSS